MLPKIIHYIWIGNNQKPDMVLKCIESWKKYMPDYEIIEWNESNYDVHSVKYMDEAYSEKKWAFVSDYMRFDVLNKHGGIYFDTDVELLKPIPESILETAFFTGVEQSGLVNPGLLFACCKDNWLCKEMLESYKNSSFDKNVMFTTNMRLTDILKKYGYIEKNEYQQVKDLHIYPSEIFCGYDLDVHEYDIKEETISVHHYLASWSKPTVKKVLQKIVKKILGVKNYKKFILTRRRIKQCVLNSLKRTDN